MLSAATPQHLGVLPCCAPPAWNCQELRLGNHWKLARSGAPGSTQLLSSKENDWRPRNPRHVFREQNLEPS